MSSSSIPNIPTHARPSHRITTPRLILRSGIPSDAKAVATIRSEPLNNPHGGVHDPDLSPEIQAQRLTEQVESTRRGENAWMQILLKPEFTEYIVDELLANDGVMIGMTGFNSFPKEGDLGDTSTQVLVGDTGAMIDYRYARRGYALEAMEAVFEYGFGVLGCGIMSLDTDKENEPWRALMRSMGLGDVEVVRRIEEGKRTGEDEVSYRFDRAKWEICKRVLEERGKWLL